MDAKKAYKLLSRVPAEDFIIGQFTDQKGKCCAVGHLVRLTTGDPDDYSLQSRQWEVFESTSSEIGRFRAKVMAYLNDVHKTYASLAAVNNGYNINGYNEDGIKDRVMHLLSDMIKNGY